MSAFLLSIEFEVLSLALLSILYLMHLKDKKERLNKQLGFIYITTIVISVIKLLSNLFPLSWVSGVLYGLCGAGACGVAYFWLIFCAGRFELDKFKSSLWRAVCAIPFAVSCLIVPYYERMTYGRLLVALLCGIYLATVLLLSLDKVKIPLRIVDERRELAGITLPAFFLGVIPALIVPVGYIPSTFAIGLTLMLLSMGNLHDKAITDELTEIPNRYGLDEEIDDQLDQYEKDNNDSFYLIAGDIDNFKTINDDYGHEEGDRALRIIAEVLTGVCDRNNAFAFRNGGDEFIIITDKADDGLADKICEEIEDELESVYFRDDFQIKMSLGISKFDGNSTIAQLKARADESLYVVKRSRKAGR